MAEIPAGWYPDPSGNTTQLRYWNGSQWTDNYAPASYGTAQSEPPAPETQAEFVDAQTIPNPPEQPYTPPQYNQPSYQQPYQQSYVAPSYTNDTDRTLRLIAFILNVVTCIGWAFTIIPLAWMIPMTVHSWGIYKGTKPNTVAFGVCTLIFLNLISGILYLVSTKDQ